MAQKMLSNRIIVSNNYEEDEDASKTPDEIIVNNAIGEQSNLTDNASKEKEAKDVPSISPDKTKQTTQGTNQKTMQQNTMLNTSEIPKKEDGLPVHEPKLIEKKNDQPNDMLNYSLTASTRAINKIPKGKYGYVEEYDLIKAEKFLSKRRTNVKYDSNMVYGKPTGSAIVTPKKDANVEEKTDEIIANTNEDVKERAAGNTNSNAASRQKLNSTDMSLGNRTQEIIEEKEEEDDEEIHEHNNQHHHHENKEVKYKPPLKRKKNKTPNINNPQEDTNHHREEDIKRKHHSAQVSFEDINHNNNDPNSSNRHPVQTQGKVNSENKNFRLLFEQNNQDDIPTNNQKKKKHHHYSQTEDNINTPPEQQNQAHDIYSCDNCEPVYLLCIMSNEPLKVLKCLICNNLINKTSLEFYLNKYKSSIVSKKPQKTDKRQVKETRVQKCADDTGLTEHWGRIIESNKASVQEKIIYDIVDGKSKLKPYQKEQYLNKVKNTPYEEIVKRKVIQNIKVKK